MNTRLSKYVIALAVICSATRVSARPVWPILATDDPAHYNTVNCTFGEIHPTNGDHFHQGIDIDCTNGNVPVRPIENGVIRTRTATTLEIGYGTPNANGDYPRKTIIREFTPNANLNQGSLVAAGVTNLGTLGNHLHFEMWYLDGNTYHPVNPLKNNVGWELPYYQYVTDTYNPQVNDVIVQPITQPPQPNGVASDVQILATVGGLSETINGVQQNSFVKAHLLNTIPPVNYSTGPIFQYPNDKLMVFGNIGFMTNVRDAGINSAPGAAANTSSGEGITIQHLNYCIDEQPCLDPQAKYVIYFDRINDGEQNDVTQMFHTAFNNANTNDRLTGNNDFIELSSMDATYLYPHKLINGIQSNGIWFTKARNTTPHVFAQTPADIAAVNEEALYPDGEHTLTFHVEDAAGRIDRAENKAEDNAQVRTIVDNFRPYVKKVRIDSSFPIYSSTWYWTRNGAQGTLALTPDASGNQADRGKPLSITVTTSEPMTMATDATGKPTGSVNIKLFARDPNNPNRITTEQA